MGGVAVSNETITITALTYGDVTLTAGWEIGDSGNYTITYAKGAEDGTIVLPTTPVTYNIETSIILSGATRTGYTFAGWTATSENGNWTAEKYVVGTTYTGMYGNVTLTATWTEHTYTIAFDANNGTGTMTSITGVKYTASVTLTANSFTRTGYTFAGWKDASGKD